MSQNQTSPATADQLAGAVPAAPAGPAGPAAPPERPGLLGRLGRGCYRRRWLTLITWIVGAACLIALWINFGAGYDNNFSGSDPGQAVLNEHFHAQSGDQLTLAIRSSAGIASPAVRAQVTAALATFRGAHITAVTGPYQVPGRISRDGHIAFATVQFDKAGSDLSNAEALALMQDARAASGHGVTFNLGGDIVDQAETPYGGAADGIGVGAAMIVLLIAFGSLLAMSLPVATALFGIGSGLSLIALIGHIAPAPSFSPIIASMIGLGVGVDYALFIVTRFREVLRNELATAEVGGKTAAGKTVAGAEIGEAAKPAPAARAGRRSARVDGTRGGLGGSSPRGSTAVVTAMSTAGRSVLVAGTTVVIGMLGLLVLRLPLLNGVAIAASATVAMTVLGSLTLLPALLGFSGTRLAKPSRIRLRRRASRATARYGPSKRPAAERWAGVVQRRPVTAAVVSAAVILLLAAPALGIKLSFPDESAEAQGTMGHATYTTMAQGFGPGFDAPLIVAATLPRGPGAGPAVARLAAAVRATPGVVSVTPTQVSPDGRAAVMIAYPSTGEQNPATNTLVNRISGTVLPRATAGTGVRAYLTGPNAANVAFANTVGARLPWLVAIVVALSMVLLTAVFRSVTVAVKAAVMNLLSISAAYGVLVMISQDGWGRQLFGFPENVPVTTWVPIFLFVILFGLSMDYEVFLLSRIREAYDATGDNAASVARGLASTARVISAAAAIMVVVFLSFVAGANVSVKQVGLGLAAAVLIDATLVRLVLVPAVMELLGRANWWLPRPLARILPPPAR